MSIRAKQSLRGTNNVGDVLKGDPGVTFTPELDEHGNLTWTNNGNLENPAAVNIKGPKGDTGEPGKEGQVGEAGPQGAPGEPGAPGKSAYEYAQEAGYTGTEEEFAEKLASDKAGASSWNDLEDKPFGETTVKGDTLTWDGNTEGLVSVGDMFFKVSDAVLTDEQIASATVVNNEGTSFVVAEQEALDRADGIVLYDGYAFVSKENVTVMGQFTFAETGIYLMWFGADLSYISSLTIPGYNGFETTTIQPIETKYLPEHLQFGTETKVVGGDTIELAIDSTGMVPSVVLGNMKFFYLSDAVVTIDDLANGYTVRFTDTKGEKKEISCTADEVGALEPGKDKAIGIWELRFICVAEDSYEVSSEGPLVFPKKGIYLYSLMSVKGLPPVSLTIPGYTGFVSEQTVVTPIDEKYLPDSVKGGGTASAIPDDEMLEFLMDMNIVQPVSNANNSVFTDTNDKVYVL